MMYFILSKKSCIIGCLIMGCAGILLGSILLSSTHAGSIEHKNLSVVIDVGHGACSLCFKSSTVF